MSTHADELQRLFNYHYWATHRLLQVVAELSPEEFSREVAGSYGSVRNTLVHTLSAEWGWLERCGGWPRGEKLNPEKYPTLASLIDQWSRVEARIREYLGATSEEQLNAVVEFELGRKFRQERGQLLRHACTHAVHHRGQVALLIRAMGRTPGNFDLLFFVDEVGSKA